MRRRGLPSRVHYGLRQTQAKLSAETLKAIAEAVLRNGFGASVVMSLAVASIGPAARTIASEK